MAVGGQNLQIAQRCRRSLPHEPRDGERQLLQTLARAARRRHRGGTQTSRDLLVPGKGASNRQPAKNVPLYADNITPQTELDKLNIPRETIFISRDRGTGRPTKKERREIDALMDGIYLEDD